MAAKTRTIPVHALGDKRIHLAPAHPGRLRQGQLKTLCGVIAVTALSPFVLAEPEKNRCKTCFGAGDEAPARANPQKATGSRDRGAREPRSKPHSGRKTPKRAARNS